MATVQEQDETGNNTTFDDLLDRGILFLGEQFTEPSRGIELALRVVRENATNHVLRGLWIPTTAAKIVLV